MHSETRVKVFRIYFCRYIPLFSLSNFKLQEIVIDTNRFFNLGDIMKFLYRISVIICFRLKNQSMNVLFVSQ